MNVMDVVKPWESVNAALGLTGPVRDAAHYEALLAFVEECFDRFGGQDDHPIFALVALVGDHIREYEDRVHPWPDSSTPSSILAYLMEAHRLTQSDMPEIGPQSVVSEVLRGKRALNLRQVKALAARFHVPMEAFAA